MALTDPDALARWMGDVDFPASKEQLVAHAERAGADPEVRRALRALPLADYRNLEEVMQSVPVAVERTEADRARHFTGDVRRGGSLADPLGGLARSAALQIVLFHAGSPAFGEDADVEAIPGRSAAHSFLLRAQYACFASRTRRRARSPSGEAGRSGSMARVWRRARSATVAPRSVVGRPGAP